MARPDGIPGSAVAGPFAVGAYAARLRDRLRSFAKVQIFGEVVGFRVARTREYFELRDGGGALPCSMWLSDWEALRLPPLADGVQVVAQGGCDYYPGSRQSSPSFSFTVARLSLAGEGDLLAQLAEVRRRLDGEGLFEPQKRLPRVGVPRCIGVVTGESGKARDDVLAGLARRGWQGRIVWAFAPVQDRHAAGAVTRAVQDLAASGAVDVIIVARGGGSMMDLFAFCDETLCRTVSMLRVPVIASVGHHTDRTLIDDVAAVSCSTPTHAAEAAVPVHCGEARAGLAAISLRLDRHGRRALADGARLNSITQSLARVSRRAVLDRARRLAVLSRAPDAHLERQRVRLHQSLREIRAAGARVVAMRRRDAGTRAVVLGRKAVAAGSELDRARGRTALSSGAVSRASAEALARRRETLDSLLRTLEAHNPQRTLERGYALVETPDGEPVTSAGAARSLDRMKVRLHDGSVDVRRDA